MNAPRDSLRQKLLHRMAGRMLAMLRVDYIEEPVAWAERNVDLGRDITSNARGMINLDDTPYLKRPLQYAMGKGKRLLTVQAVEQTAKSMLWKLIVMWLMKFRSVPIGLVYQNKEVGGQIIRDSLVPLMKGVNSFRHDLASEGWSMKRIKVGGRPLYLMTGDSPIISYPMAVMIGDEVNDWRQERAARKAVIKRQSAEEYQVSKILDMDKRTRTFDDSLRVLVCSPTGYHGPITLETEKSSKGKWHLRCQGCRELTIDTTASEEYMQYDTTEAGDVIPESCRLVCPECGYVHREDSRRLTTRKMTLEGGYIDEFPERIDTHMGCNWGALAAPFPGVAWPVICQAIEATRRSHGREAAQYLANSINGVHYRPEVVTGDKLDAIRAHQTPELPPEIISKLDAIYMTVDTQDVGYWWTVLGVDGRENWYVLDYGYSWDDHGIIDAWKAKYCGFRPIAGMIDEGGHRKKDVDRLVAKLGKGFWKYKGADGRSTGKSWWKESGNDDEPLLILGHADHFKAELLYLLYAAGRAPDRQTTPAEFLARAENPEENNNLFICCEIKKTYIAQMASVQPPMNNLEADFEDWTPAERQHDLFDTHKMALVLHEFAKKKFSPSAFLHHRVPGAPARQGQKIVIKKSSRQVGGGRIL